MGDALFADEPALDRCPKRVANTPAPPGFTVEQLKAHPTYRFSLIPGARCELPVGHGGGTADDDVARRHRCGGLLWWDPPLIVVEGRHDG